MRRTGEPIVRGPALLAGDAAGLVDPFSGEGIHGAFVSGRLAAESIGRRLSGETEDLRDYEDAVDRELMQDFDASRKLHAVFNLTPRPVVAMMRRSDRFWRTLAGIVRGEATYAGFVRRLGPLRLLLDATARALEGRGSGPAGR
jgi:flavin-dependent dehydrogenase